jgi:hypothetical protein
MKKKYPNVGTVLKFKKWDIQGQYRYTQTIANTTQIRFHSSIISALPSWYLDIQQQQKILRNKMKKKYPNVGTVLKFKKNKLIERKKLDIDSICTFPLTFLVWYNT